MEISKEELQGIIAEATKPLLSKMKEMEEAIKGGDGGTTRLLRRVTERRVSVAMIDGKVVVGFRNVGSETRPQRVYNKQDPKNPRETIQFVDLILEGMKGNDKLTVPYTEFRKESEKVVCKIIETKEHEWVMNQGTVKKREVEGYSMLELDYDVPLDVVGKVRLYTVEIPESHGGPRKVTVHEDYINIS